MRTMLLLVALIVAVSAGAQVDLTKPVPRIRLADGRVLQEITFTQFKALDMLVRHKGGSMVLRYEALPDEIRSEAEKKRPGGPRWFPGETAESSTPIEGQVFVQTRGTGAYKFGEVKVYAFASAHLEAWKRVGFDQVVALPKPLAVATTDGDGKFRMSVPKDAPYFLFCQTSRMFTDGSHEYNEWRVPGETFKNPKEAFLTGKNLADRTSRVTIEETL
jgi:hypothetical protein